MEARLGKKGKREYVQTFPLVVVAHAIDDALRLPAISFDAVKHLLRVSAKVDVLPERDYKPASAIAVVIIAPSEVRSCVIRFPISYEAPDHPCLDFGLRVF